jgi:glycosyltransferase involved in cell wall biosynthesis
MTDFYDQGIEYSLLSDIHMRENGKSLTPKKLGWIKNYIAKLERKSGFQSRLYFWSSFVRFKREFRSADIIHYHILHNEFFRLESLKNLTKRKRSIWTFHDLWIATGHCIQPLDCERFEHGCGSCPDLKRTIAVARDRTSKELTRKKRLLSKLDCDYIVSTNWMKQRILQNLPIDLNRLHVIPFGVDTKFFKPINLDEGNSLKRQLSLDLHSTYVFMNAHNDIIKGIDIVESLIHAAITRPNVKFLLVDDSKKFQFSPNVISFPRAYEPHEVRNLIQASDFVIIPSRGESFSLLALESMSCGKPVITPRYSAPHEVTNSSLEFTFNLRTHETDLIDVIDSLEHSPEYCIEEGKRNRQRVIDMFSKEIHLNNMSRIYQSIGNGVLNA